MSFKLRKTTMRKQFFKKRGLLSMGERLEKEAAIFGNFRTVIDELLKNKSSNFKDPENITLGSFMPIQSEINAYQILLNAHKQHPDTKMCFPAVISLKKGQMDFRQYTRDGDLKVGFLNILECKDHMEVLYPDILITPLCAYDKELNRLGFGSGFYDRYISNLRKMKPCYILGCAYQLQFFEGDSENGDLLPHDEYDQRFDYLINEHEILH